MPYILNGQQAAIAEEPNQRNGTVYVPFRAVIEALGGQVGWDPSSQQASGTIGQWTATLKANSTTADVSGTTVQFQSPSFEENGEIYVPAKFFHDAYGYKVQVNGTEVNIGL